MPIIVKELHIKVNIDENIKSANAKTFDPSMLKDLKAEIIRICTKRVLEKLDERQQR